jgi:hypothetical protein
VCTIELVGGIEVKVTVGMGVSAGVAVASGIQETKTIASKTMISFFVSIFLPRYPNCILAMREFSHQ